MVHPYPLQTPIQHTLTFFPGPNLFNHSTIGKIIRFAPDDYGFICLQCGANYSASAAFLAHIETHDQINAPEPAQLNGHGEAIPADPLNEAIVEPTNTGAGAAMPNSYQTAASTTQSKTTTVNMVPVRKSTRTRRKPLSKFDSSIMCECVFCLNEYCTDGGLRRHKLRAHGQILSKIKVKDDTRFCSLCGVEFGIRQIKSAEKHMKTHVDNGDFKPILI